MSKKKKEEIENTNPWTDIKESIRLNKNFLGGWYWVQGITDVISWIFKINQGAPGNV